MWVVLVCGSAVRVWVCVGCERAVCVGCFGMWQCNTGVCVGVCNVSLVDMLVCMLGLRVQWVPSRKSY